MTNEENDQFDIAMRNRHQSNQKRRSLGELFDDNLLSYASDDNVATTMEFSRSPRVNIRQFNAPDLSGNIPSTTSSITSTTTTTVTPHPINTFITSTRTTTTNTLLEPDEAGIKQKEASPRVGNQEKNNIQPEKEEENRPLDYAKNGVISYDNFRKNSNLGVSPSDKKIAAYNNLFEKLTIYHSKLNSFKQTLLTNRNATMDSGRELNDLIKREQQNNEQIKNLNADLGSLNSDIRRQTNQKNTEGKSEEEIIKIDSKLSELQAKKELKEQEIASIAASVTRESIEELRARYNANIDAELDHQKQAQEIRDFSIAFKENNNYKNSKNDEKNVYNSLGDKNLTAANIEKDIRDALENVWGLPYDLILKERPIQRGKDSANVTYEVKTNSITGFGKRAMIAGEPANPNTNNLNIATTDDGILIDNPNMIARSVKSHEVDKFFGIGVTSYETYTKDFDGRLMGVSGTVSGHQCEKFSDTELRPIFNDNLLTAVFNDGNTQRMLAKMQLSDALTGQSDRHFGNVFIEQTQENSHIKGKVIDIDQDQSLPSDNDFLIEDSKNYRPGQQLHGQFSRDKNGKLICLLNLIPAEDAKRVLSRNEKEYRTMLGNMVGNERLPEKSVDAAIERWKAVKTRIEEIKKGNVPGGRLVAENEWGKDTFDILTSDKGGKKIEAKSVNFTNYLIKGVYLAQMRNADGTPKEQSNQPRN